MFLSCGADRFGGRLKGGWCGDWPPTPLPLLHLKGRGRTNRTLGLSVLDGPPFPTRGRRAVSPARLRLLPRGGLAELDGPPSPTWAEGRKPRQAAACCPAAALQRWTGSLPPRGRRALSPARLPYVAPRRSRSA